MTQPIRPFAPNKSIDLRPGQFRAPERSVEAMNFRSSPLTVDGKKLPQVTSTTSTTNEDGTPVTTYIFDDGTRTVREDRADGSRFFQYYGSDGKLTVDSHEGTEIETMHHYDKDGKVITEGTNNTKENTSEYKNYKYYDNGQPSEVIVTNSKDLRTNCETTTRYDEKGNQTEKFEQKGAVTTYFGVDNKPIKRETDKGQGIIETEDLTQ